MVLVSSPSRAVVDPAHERERRRAVPSIGPASVAPAQCASDPRGDITRE